MNLAGKSVLLGAAALVALATGPVMVCAQESLGNEKADAMVAELQTQEPTATLTCTFVGEIVTCGGTKIGSCVALGWHVNHDGGTCRKSINE